MLAAGKKRGGDKQILGIKRGEYRDCTKTKGTSVRCKCSTELVFGIKRKVSLIPPTNHNPNVLQC